MLINATKIKEIEAMKLSDNKVLWMRYVQRIGGKNGKKRDCNYILIKKINSI